MLSKGTIKEESYFDIVMANSVIHHIENQEAGSLFELAHFALKLGGRLVTIDSCYNEKQSPIARYLFSKGRGKYTRTRDAYLILAASVFTNVKTHIRQDLLRIPYTHIIMECAK